MTRLAGGGSAGGVTSGSMDGASSAARFYNPSGIAVSTSGTVYVADTFNHLIRMISPTGLKFLSTQQSTFCYVQFALLVGVVTRLAGGGSAGGVAAGSVDGTGSAALFNSPFSVSVSTLGTVYVADTSTHLIRMISPAGNSVQ